MKLLDALQWRYAVKKMNGTKIPAEKLETIIEAIRLAPSGFGLTPYSIIVVEDEETRKKLHPAFYNQSQVVDGSVVIVFAAWNAVSEKDIAEYMQDIADQRGVSLDSLAQFSGVINGSFKNMTPEQARVWADKQAYLALGFSLVAAAAEEVDATPMEGFAPDTVDEILGLKALGLHSTVALTLGFRDAANDYLVNAKKVRRTTDKLVIKK
ncbi:MAG: NAD(P)H-dependent oxidoreductase [Chitinophagaceae bacterium]|nr:NAD(P)H-dependent oxidoreductase [Chitinophagaceae bacterium]